MQKPNIASTKKGLKISITASFLSAAAMILTALSVDQNYLGQVPPAVHFLVVFILCWLFSTGFTFYYMDNILRWIHGMEKTPEQKKPVYPVSELQGQSICFGIEGEGPNLIFLAGELISTAKWFGALGDGTMFYGVPAPGFKRCSVRRVSPKEIQFSCAVTA